MKEQNYISELHLLGPGDDQFLTNQEISMMPTTNDLFFYHVFIGQSLDVTLSPFGLKLILFLRKSKSYLGLI